MPAWHSATPRALGQPPEPREVFFQLLLRVPAEEARDVATRPPSRRVIAAHEADEGSALRCHREDGLAVRAHIAADRAPDNPTVGCEDDHLRLPIDVYVECCLGDPAEGAPPRAPHVEHAARPARRRLEVGEQVEDTFDRRVNLDETLVPPHTPSRRG